MTAPGDQSGPTVFQHELVLEKHQEPGMSLSRRQWDRHLERIEKCKEGWNVLWLAGASTSIGVAVTTFFMAIGIPVPAPGTAATGSQLSGGTRADLFIVAAFSLVLFAVALGAYLMRRKDRDSEIAEVIKDMRIHEPPE